MLYRLGRTGAAGGAGPHRRRRRPAPGRGDRGARPAQAAEVDGAGRWRTSLAFWGFIVLGATILEALRRAVRPGLRHPAHRPPGRGSGSSRTSSPWRCWSRLAVVRRHPARARATARGPPSRFFGSHTGAAWLVLFMIFNVVWTPAALPRRPDQHRRTSRTSDAARSPPSGSRSCSSRSGTTANEVIETVGILLADRRHARRSSCSSCTPSTCTSSLAPLNVAFSRRPDAPSARCCRCTPSGKPIDFEDPGEDDTVRPRQGRGLHLEGHARLRHLHRVRPLPVASARPGTPASRCRPSC